MPNQIEKSREEIDSYDLFQIPNAYEDVNQIVNKIYLSSLKNCEIIPCEDNKALDISESACFFPISRIVLDKSEDILQKLSNVYSSAWGVNANVVMIIRGYATDEIEISLGVCGEKSRINGAYPKMRVLYDSFIGNFPGCRDDKTVILNAENTRVLLNKCYDSNFNSIASVSCIASLRDERHNQNVGFYQGLDKVIETMNEKNYSIVIIARPVQTPEIEMVRYELEDLYSRLSGYAKIQLGFNWSVAEAFSQALSTSVTNGLNTSTSVGLNVGTNTTEGNFKNSYWGIHGGASVLGGSLGGGSGTSNATTTTLGNTFSKIIAENTARIDGKSSIKSDTTTSGRSVQFTVENKTIIETLAKIDAQLKRLKRGSGMGMFATAAYFFSPTITQTRVAASVYKAVISGSNTDLENSAINIWFDKNYQEILKYLRSFQHPRFKLYPKTAQKNVFLTTTPAVLTTSFELAISMGLPRNKINGIPVLESVSFERSVYKMNATHSKANIKLGNIYHLYHEEKTSVSLNLDDLTMHCLVTGTTGSGKSNTVYGLIEKILAARNNIRFMVIEPAKGEYKMIFGHRQDVEVYGTNSNVTKLLRINPFRFRTEVHVLEHIDSLVSIFNVCWMMEAAMPAVLKQAIERAYKNSGWDLKKSLNHYDNELFPNFRDVLDAINQIMDETNYSTEVSDNYKGALCTRLQELMTGLNSLIFVSNDLSDEELFERNVVVDLSRLNSSETKSLIMGLMIIKLKEYRQSIHNPISSELRHVTVLEEAHNLLKNTQAQNISSIVSKSVEMISNSLAEMRSTGEGFIIVDQSPCLLDLSAIRNTNTKILLRLPDASDRELVGHAMNLNASQIGEISRFPTGIAAVYQNDWLGTVLVKIPEEKFPSEPFNYEPAGEEIVNQKWEESLHLALMNFQNGELTNWIKALGKNSVAVVARLQISTKLKTLLIACCRELENGKDDIPTRPLYSVAYEFYHAETAINAALRKGENINSIEEFQKIAMAGLKPNLENCSYPLRLFTKLILEYHRYHRDNEHIRKIVTEIIKS